MANCKALMVIACEGRAIDENIPAHDRDSFIKRCVKDAVGDSRTIGHQPTPLHMRAPAGVSSIRPAPLHQSGGIAPSWCKRNLPQIRITFDTAVDALWARGSSRQSVWELAPSPAVLWVIARAYLIPLVFPALSFSACLRSPITSPYRASLLWALCGHVLAHR
jgi:hypothetical protein